MLQYFGVPSPPLCADVSPQVEDLSIRNVAGVKGSMSMREAWNLMRDIDANTLAIVDDERRMEGLITMTDVAKAYMDVFDSDTMSKARTSYTNLVNTLDGEMIVGDINSCVCSGKLCVAAGNAATMASVHRKGRRRDSGQPRRFPDPGHRAGRGLFDRDGGLRRAPAHPADGQKPRAPPSSKRLTIPTPPPAWPARARRCPTS